MGNTIIPPHLQYLSSSSPSNSRFIKWVTVGDETLPSTSSSSSRLVKCVVVGDAEVGKTCMLTRFTRDEFPTEYIPAVFDCFSANVVIEGTAVNLSLWDTAGQEEYDRVRPQSYPHTDFFLVAFSLVCRASYENVLKKWFPELQHHDKGVPVVLAGTKLDLREDKQYLASQPGLVPVTTVEGKELQKQIGAAYYIECSSKTKEVVCFPRGSKERSKYGIKKKPKESSAFPRFNERESLILISHPRRFSIINTSPVDETTSKHEDGVAQWPIHIEEHFIHLLCGEAKNGLQISTLDNKGWAAIDNAIFSKFGKRYTIPMLKSKYNCLRKLYCDFAKLLARTGMSWDQATNTMDASEDIWDSYIIKKNPSSKSFCKKGCNHHVLDEIFKDTISTRQMQNASTQTPSDCETKIELDTEIISFGGCLNHTSCGVETFNKGHGDINETRGCSVSPDSDLSSRKESRTSEFSKLDDVLEAWEKSLTARIEASLAVVDRLKKQEASSSTCELASIEDCMEILEAMDGLDDVSYIRACEKFTNSDWRRIFMKMSDARKKMWLKTLK